MRLVPKLTEAQETDLKNRFGYHKPATDEHRLDIETSRAFFLDMARRLTALLPPGREASLAMTNLEQASFWANAAIARSWGDAEPFDI